jgi:hypothetical protein
MGEAAMPAVTLTASASQEITTTGRKIPVKFTTMIQTGLPPSSPGRTITTKITLPQDMSPQVESSSPGKTPDLTNKVLEEASGPATTLRLLLA